MNVTRITQLFSVPGGLSEAQQPQTTTAQSPTAQTKGASAEDAATVKGGVTSDPAARRARIEELKNSVQSGAYEYNRTAVATALYRDLA